MQFYDFGYVLFCIPVSYFGGRHSKPVVLGAGLALIATGSILFSTPHMLADSYSTNQENKAYGSCSIQTPWNISDADAMALTASCEAEKQTQPGTFRYVVLFCLAHFLHGVGATPLYTIGVSYIDENVGKALSSLYVGECLHFILQSRMGIRLIVFSPQSCMFGISGIFYSFAVFGPAAGFLSAGSFLTYHTDFWHLPAEQILRVSGDESDPSWVGAWWLGFVLASVVALVAVIPIICLPKVLPESLKWHR
ncbi:unnamed protein product [Cylicostephanus goldi]|uniref:Major facilitator superfamily (MFS) profile domain-containing protein n=1 Tax=Cylicostephanus goldi TaxID=71465 RepID=A0A3P6SKE0_CYLGO|nr:unnamed protein product [Cylicostephanus goldi]